MYVQISRLGFQPFGLWYFYELWIPCYLFIFIFFSRAVHLRLRSVAQWGRKVVAVKHRAKGPGAKHRHLCHLLRYNILLVKYSCLILFSFSFFSFSSRLRKQKARITLIVLIISMFFFPGNENENQTQPESKFD